MNSAGRFGLALLCALAGPVSAPARAIELAQYQVAPQYQYPVAPQYPGPPLYWPSPPRPQYQSPPPVYQGPQQVPRAPVYEPGPYDNYNHGNGP